MGKNYSKSENNLESKNEHILKNENFEINGYKKIDYPLNNIDIDFNDESCNNWHRKNHDNIEIQYENRTNDIPTIYRCPICLCIPILYYNELKIFYKCNCGCFNCSIDYFFHNFISYTINDIKIKGNSKNEEIAYCSSCSQFITDIDKHKNEYYGHIIKIINDIFLKSDSSEQGEYRYHYNSSFDSFQFDGINTSSNEKKTNYDFHYNNKLKYKDIIINCLKFEIILEIYYMIFIHIDIYYMIIIFI